MRDRIVSVTRRHVEFLAKAEHPLDTELQLPPSDESTVGED